MSVKKVTCKNVARESDFRRSGPKPACPFHTSALVYSRVKAMERKLEVWVGPDCHGSQTLRSVQDPWQSGPTHTSSFLSIALTLLQTRALVWKGQAGFGPLLLKSDSLATFLQVTFFTLINAFVSESFVTWISLILSMAASVFYSSESFSHLRHVYKAPTIWARWW